MSPALYILGPLATLVAAFGVLILNRMHFNVQTKLRVTVDIFDAHIFNPAAKWIYSTEYDLRKELEFLIPYKLGSIRAYSVIKISNIGRRKTSNVTIRDNRIGYSYYDIDEIGSSGVIRDKESIFVGDMQPKDVRTVHILCTNSEHGHFETIKSNYIVSADEADWIYYRYPTPEYIKQKIISRMFFLGNIVIFAIFIGGLIEWTVRYIISSHLLGL